MIARPATSVLLLVDLQDTLLRRLDPALRRDVVESCMALHQAASALGTPSWVAELDPRTFGRALPQLAPLSVREHVRLSIADEDLLVELRALGRTTVVLAGVERHGAVALTAIELAAAGLDVRVVVDATASRAPIDATLALDRLRAERVTLTSVEAQLLEWADDARSPTAVDLLRHRR